MKTEGKPVCFVGCCGIVEEFPFSFIWTRVYIDCAMNNNKRPK